MEASTTSQSDAIELAEPTNYEGLIYEFSFELAVTIDRVKDLRRNVPPDAPSREIRVLDDILAVLASLDETLSPHKPHLSREKTAKPTTSVTTLQKIALALAVKYHGYDGENRRNAATGHKAGSISTTLEELGLSIDSDTVRSALREAWDEFGGNLAKPSVTNRR